MELFRGCTHLEPFAKQLRIPFQISVRHSSLESQAVFNTTRAPLKTADVASLIEAHKYYPQAREVLLKYGLPPLGTIESPNPTYIIFLPVSRSPKASACWSTHYSPKMKTLSRIYVFSSFG